MRFCSSVSYGSESSPIGDLSEVCHTVPAYTYVDGDCTVPIESAMFQVYTKVAQEQYTHPSARSEHTQAVVHILSSAF